LLRRLKPHDRGFAAELDAAYPADRDIALHGRKLQTERFRNGLVGVFPNFGHRFRPLFETDTDSYDRKASVTFRDECWGKTLNRRAARRFLSALRKRIAPMRSGCGAGRLSLPSGDRRARLAIPSHAQGKARPDPAARKSR